MAERIRSSRQPRVVSTRVIRKKRKIGFLERLWRRIEWKYKLLVLAAAMLTLFTYLANPQGQTTETFVLGPGETAPAETGQTGAQQPAQTGAGLPALKVETGTTGGIPWTMAYPVSYNKAKFKAAFPGVAYCGDIGDASHQNVSFPQDHTPKSAEVYNGTPMKRGWIYAQDFCGGATYSGPMVDSFNLPLFVRWLLDEKRKDKNKYPEIKYIISRNAANSACGKKYFGFFGFEPDGSIEWDTNSDHTGHVHISYKPGFEQAQSYIMTDYAKWRPGHSISGCGIA